MNPFKPNRPPSAALSARAEIPTPVIANGVATLRLYDVIDAWGGDWGISAGEFNAAIDALPDGIAEIRLLINSPGGEVWDGLAILNALRAHPARVIAIVEGIAASAASFIAAGCDELIMSRNSELFIHNAIGYAAGDAEVMRNAAEDLERLDRNIASIYAEKSGQTLDYWLAEMPRDRFLTAEEAVASGLADRIEGVEDQTPVAQARTARARAELAQVRGERSPRAALPELPDSSEPGDPNRKDDLVAYEDLTAGLREPLGVTETTLTDDELLAALDESLAERADIDAASAADTAASAASVPEGSVVVEAGAFAELQRRAGLGAEAHASLETARREGIVQNAINEGRIAPASRAQFLALLGKDEAGTVAALATFPKGTIPVAELGHSETDTISDNDRLAAKAGWGTTKKGA